jgi:hypothetical protein
MYVFNGQSHAGTMDSKIVNIRPCPCGKGNASDLERIPRGVLLKTFLFFLPIKKYRCYRCLRVKVKYS